MQAFVTPKTRRPKFELTLRVFDLTNVPLVSGTSFVKWQVPRPTGDQHGRTAKCHIRDHKVAYDYSTTIQVQLTVDRSGILQEHYIHFDVCQEYGGGAKGERITLGRIKLNLAEYADENLDLGSEDHDIVARRYLLQGSRINSTLKIGLHMKLIEGERNFTTPKSNATPVFGAIAGIVAAEQADRDDGIAVPSLSNKGREAGETQDLYRQNLAAYWSSQPGELKADECIENIFAGGDGWGKPYTSHPSVSATPDDRSSSFDRGESQNRWSHRRNPSRDSDRSLTDVSGQSSIRSGGTRQMLGVSGRSSLEQQANEMKAEVKNAPDGWQKEAAEVNEFDVREDLKAWKISSSKVF